MEVVGLIPARSGSKGIPGKNVVLLAGRPLIAWTIAAAQASRSLTRVVVSTDSEEIAALSREQGAETPFLRPPAIAADETPMVEVVLHALDELERCDVLVLLQPTSPLRRAEHVDGAVSLLLESGADCVVSVVEVPHRYEPGSQLTIEDGLLVRLDPSSPMLRQDKPVTYARNGPAVLVVRPEVVRARGELYGGACRPYRMDERDSLDVDGEFELELAECLLRHANGSSDGQF